MWLSGRKSTEVQDTSCFRHGDVGGGECAVPGAERTIVVPLTQLEPTRVRPTVHGVLESVGMLLDGVLWKHLEVNWAERPGCMLSPDFGGAKWVAYFRANEVSSWVGQH